VRLLPDPRLLPAFLTLFAYPAIDRWHPVFAFLLILALLALALWLCLPKRGKGTEKRSTRTEWIAAGALAAILVLGPLALAALVERWWVEIGTLSGWSFRLGLYGLLAAVIVLGLLVALRPADNPVGVFLSGAGIGAILAISAFLGQIPGWWLVDLPARALGLDSVPGVLAGVGTAALLAGLAFLLTVPLERDNAVRLLASWPEPAAAGIALLLPFIFAIAAVSDRRGVEPGAETGFAHGTMPAVAPSAQSPAELARSYRPVFLIDRNERWPLDSVDAYVQDATISKLAHGTDPPVPEHPGVENLPRSCGPPEADNQGPEPICYVLTDGCPDVRKSCDNGRGPWPRGTLREGAVYARVVTRGSPPTDGSPDVFGEPVPYDGLQTLIQYWLFYRNDLWRADTGFGRLVQSHEADWELVMVGLSDREPLFVAYSAHCGGQVQPWARVQTDRGARPVVWVARGSHANYPSSQPRTPDFTSCKKASPQLKLLLGGLAFAANVRETLPDTFVRQEPDVMMVDARTRAFSVPARWAPKDATLMTNLFHDAALPPPSRTKASEPSGPETPTCKAMWRDPLPILACSPYWGESGRCNETLRNRWAEPERGCI
jgi:hypothetical protein